MRKNKYKLEVVLDVRKKKKDQEINYVTKCRNKLVKEEKELSYRKKLLLDCQNQLLDADNKMISELGNGTSVANIVSFKHFLQSLKEKVRELSNSVEEQKMIIFEAKTVLNNAISELNNATKEFLVSEKHKELWLKNEKTENVRLNQKFNDEIGINFHQNSKK